MAHTQDEGFHEIQLNGKQLVFLFMAATVISVLIFLLGVLVGRGVRAERNVVAENAPTNAAAETTPPQQPAQPPVQTPTGSDPRAAAPPPAVDELSYFNRLEQQKPTTEQLKTTPETANKAPDKKASESPAPAPPPAPPAPVAAPAPAAAPPPQTRPAPSRAAADASSSEPAGDGYSVQIAALNVRGEAEAIAKRLTAKGYSAYVLSPATGSPSVFRVRIGKFPTRREADRIADKLKKEEQFNPWVTR